MSDAVVLLIEGRYHRAIRVGAILTTPTDCDAEPTAGRVVWDRPADPRVLCRRCWPEPVSPVRDEFEGEPV